MIRFDCKRTGYARELYAAKIKDWLFQQGYRWAKDYSYDWNFSVLTFDAKPGNEKMETLLALYWIGK